MTNPPIAKKARLTTTSSATCLYDKDNTDPSLLYIPFHDFPPSQTKSYQSLLHQNASTKFTNNTNNDNHDEEDEQIVLLQLPKGVSLETLTSSSSSSPKTVPTHLKQDTNISTLSSVRIVGPPPPPPASSSISSSTKKDANTSSACCLVIESTGQSFLLSRVETSNALIVLPPSLSTSSTTNTNDNHNPHPHPHPPSKIYGRWIANPTSSFLECKSYPLNTETLYNLLSTHIYNPFELYENSTSTTTTTTTTTPITTPINFGISLSELAISCQVSTYQIQTALMKIHAYQHEPHQTFGFLHEQVETFVTQGIVAVLVEEEDLHTLQDPNANVTMVETNDGDDSMSISNTKLLSDTISILQEQYPPLEKDHDMEEKDDWYHNVVQHCIRSLLKEGTGNDVENTNDIVYLDIQKIAIVIAHELFQSRSTPWPISQFLQEWHNRMPGVGPMFEPPLETLLIHGIAYIYKDKKDIQELNQSIFAKKSIGNIIPSTENPSQETQQEEQYFKYFPESKLSFQPRQRLQSCFEEKDEWTLQELEPYIHPILKLMVSSMSDVAAAPIQQQWLLQYTSQLTNEDGITKYRRK